MEQQISAMWAQVWVTAGVGLLQCALIAGGLWMMNKASNIRNRQLDIMEARQQAQSDALERQGEVLRQQGEALAELLRRSTPG